MVDVTTEMTADKNRRLVILMDEILFQRFISMQKRSGHETVKALMIDVLNFYDALTTMIDGGYEDILGSFGKDKRHIRIVDESMITKGDTKQMTSKVPARVKRAKPPAPTPTTKRPARATKPRKRRG